MEAERVHAMAVAVNLAVWAPKNLGKLLPSARPGSPATEDDYDETGLAESAASFGFYFYEVKLE